MTTGAQTLELAPNRGPLEPLRSWRVRTLTMFLWTMLGVMLPAWLLAGGDRVERGASTWLLPMSIGLVATLVLIFWRRAGYQLRAHGLLLLLCGLAIFSPLNLGLAGMRPLYAIGLIVLAAVLLDRRGVLLYGGFCIVAAMFPFIGFLISRPAASPGYERAGAFDSLIVTNLAVIVIGTAIGGLILSLIDRLSRSLDFAATMLAEREATNHRLARLVDERTAELRRNQTLLQSLLDHAPTAIFVKDLSGRYLLTNNHMRRFNGISEPSINGQHDVELFGKLVESWHEHEQAVLAAGEPVGLEVDIPRPEGTYTYHVVRFPLRDEAGAIHAIGGIAANITERKQVEEALDRQLRLQSAVARCAQTLLRATVAPHQRDVLLAAVLDEFRMGIEAAHIGLYEFCDAPDGEPSFRGIVQMPDNSSGRPYIPRAELRAEWMARFWAGMPAMVAGDQVFVEGSPGYDGVRRRKLERLWILPVIVGGQIWGAVVLGDATPLRSDEEEAIGLLGAVSDLVGAFLSRIEARSALERKSSYAGALTACSGALLARLQHDEPQSEALIEAVTTLRDVVGCQRSSVYAFADQGGEQLGARIVAESCAPGLTSDPRANRLPCAGFPPALAAELRAGRPSGDVVDVAAAEASPFHQRLYRAGVRAALFVPLQVADRLWGFLMLSDQDAERQWAPDETQLLQTAAEMMGAFVRSGQLLQGLREREQFLERRESLLRTTSDALPNGFLYQILQDREGRDHGTNYISGGVKQLLGHSAEELRKLPALFDTIVLPDDLAAYREAAREAGHSMGMFDVELRARRHDGRVGWFQLRAVPQSVEDGLVLWNGVVLESTARKEAELALQRVNGALHRRIAELATLNQIAQALMSWIDLPAALTTVGALLLPLFGAERIAIWLREDGRDSLGLLSLIGRDTVTSGGQTVPLASAPLARKALALRHGVVIEGGRHDPVVIPPLAHGPEAMGYSALVQPLLVRGTPVGLLVVRSRDQHQRFTPSDVELAQTITGLLSSAIEQRRLYQRTMLEAALEERRRLARELHDSITQSLYSLALLARAWGRMALSEPPTTVTTWFKQVEEIAVQSLKEMRLLIYQLRSPELEALGLAAMLRQRIEAVEQRTGITTRLEDADYRAPAAPELEAQLFAIAQEALNNALRHARASLITLTLQSDPQQVSITIRDDGQGFDPASASGGMGLTTMRERAEGLGGNITIVSTPGEGTSVTVILPNRAAPARPPARRKPPHAQRRRP